MASAFEWSTEPTLPPSTGEAISVANFMPGRITSMPYDRFSGSFVRRVDSMHRLADQTEQRGIFQLDVSGRLEAGGAIRYLAIPD